MSKTKRKTPCAAGWLGPKFKLTFLILFFFDIFFKFTPLFTVPGGYAGSFPAVVGFDPRYRAMINEYKSGLMVLPVILYLMQLIFFALNRLFISGSFNDVRGYKPDNHTPNKSNVLFNWFFFALFAGVPPLVGFFAKIALFSSLLFKAGFIWSIFFLLLNIPLIYFYLKEFSKPAVKYKNSKQQINKLSITSAFAFCIVMFHAISLTFIFWAPVFLTLLIALNC